MLSRKVIGYRRLVLILIASAILPFSASAQDHKAEMAARVFLEAEAKNWAKAWLDAHPPGVAVNSFGSKALFAIELLMAADRYRKADNDNARFHAVASGAAAFVAYSYSATPAVGIIVTAVYLCAQIVESSVMGSYAEAMLRIHKQILLSEARRQDLIYRWGMSRAYRVIVLAQGLDQMLTTSQKIDTQIQTDCKKPSTDYGGLAHCMDLITRAVALRTATKQAIQNLFLLPDEDLDLLAIEQAQDGTLVQPKPGTQRESLKTALETMTNSLADMKKVYDPMAAKYASLVAETLVHDAADKAAPFVAVEQVRGVCLSQHTKLGYAAGVSVIKLASLTSKAVKEKSADATRQAEFAQLQERSITLLQEYEQRSLGCPEIRNDTDLKLVIDSLQTELTATVK